MDRTTTLSFGDRPGPSDRHRCRRSEPDCRNLAPKNHFSRETVPVRLDKEPSADRFLSRFKAAMEMFLGSLRIWKAEPGMEAINVVAVEDLFKEFALPDAYEFSIDGKQRPWSDLQGGDLFRIQQLVFDEFLRKN